MSTRTYTFEPHWKTPGTPFGGTLTKKESQPYMNKHFSCVLDIEPGKRATNIRVDVPSDADVWFQLGQDIPVSDFTSLSIPYAAYHVAKLDGTVVNNDDKVTITYDLVDDTTPDEPFHVGNMEVLSRDGFYGARYTNVLPYSG